MNVTAGLKAGTTRAGHDGPPEGGHYTGRA